MATQTDSDYDGSIDNNLAAGISAVGRDVAATSAVSELDLSSLSSNAQISNLIGKGITVEGQQVEFYDSSKGAYAGKAIGVDVSDALEASSNKDQALASTIATQLSNKLEGVTVTASSADLLFTTTDKGENASVSLKDGLINEKYVAKLQVGANKGQSMEIEIADMRATALGITGKAGEAGFTSKSNVTNGTNSQVTEAALDVSTADKASSAVEVINKAIETVSAQRSNLGSFQNRLEHTINNLSTSAENLQAAESRIRDVDMAKEMMNFTKNNILNQAAQAMMAQSNQQPQAVLQLLR
uniref:flagellin n=1 Tax=Exiguobacterium sp. B2(2022) TaxID=2992755 RepID=UPI0031597379